MNQPQDQNQYNQQWQQGYQQNGYAGYPGYDPYGQPMVLPQSGMGIASAIIAGVTTVLMCLAFTIAGVMVANNPALAEPGVADTEPAMVAVGCLILVNGLLLVVGLVLGIVGLVQSNVRKMWAIIGVSVNGAILLGSGCLMVIGLVSP